MPDDLEKNPPEFFTSLKAEQPLPITKIEESIGDAEGVTNTIEQSLGDTEVSEVQEVVDLKDIDSDLPTETLVADQPASGSERKSISQELDSEKIHQIFDSGDTSEASFTLRAQEIRKIEEASS